MRKQTQAEVFLDIETIPSQLPWVRQYVGDTVKPPAQMKKAETIEKWYQESRAGAVDLAMDKCGLDGAMNHIICIGVAIDDHEPISFSIDEPYKEAKMLEDFYNYLHGNLIVGGNKFIGHNITGFDLKVLKQRSMIYGIKPQIEVPFNVKPWDDILVYDTMLQWDSRDFIKLKKLALAFGIEQKKTMHGSEVYTAWKNGLHDQIADYCKNDVSMVRKIYRKMTMA